MSKNRSKRREGKGKRDKERLKEVPRCKICGAPLISLEEWKRRYYWKILRGELPKPKNFDASEAAFRGKSPPTDAYKYAVEDVGGEKWRKKKI